MTNETELEIIQLLERLITWCERNGHDVRVAKLFFEPGEFLLAFNEIDLERVRRDPDNADVLEDMKRLSAYFQD